jgi:TonB family protein
MIIFGLRLLVALLTFTVGIAAAWLLGSGPSKDCGRPAAVSQFVEVTTLTVTHDAPKTRSCSLPRNSVEGGILNGRARSKPAPDYPQEAKDAGVAGTVAVKILLEDDGSVISAEAVSGPQVLRAAAEEAAREATFAPTYLGGEPVRVSGTLTYNFGLR